MMRSSPLPALLALLAAVTLLSCGDDDEKKSTDVGKSCSINIQLDGGGTTFAINTASSACFAGLCVYKSGSAGNSPICTALCTTETDCPASHANCSAGFACEAPMTVGEWKDKKVCVCKQ
jgi:hypothetical protein